MKWLVADWQGNKGHVFSDVLTSLQRLGHSLEVIPRSDPTKRDNLVTAIRSGQYDALLTWQRFYRMQTEILEAISESGIRTLFMDFGFRPHYNSVVFDSKGENATSSIAELWQAGNQLNLSQEALDDAESLMEEEACRATQIVQPEIVELSSLLRPFVFVPLQRPNDAVVRFDSSVHDFGKLLRRVLLLAHNKSYVVCKTHPLDNELDLGVPDRIDPTHSVIRRTYGQVNEQICDFLLSQAELVVGVNSNMLFRAVLFGTPVLATGRGWYTGSGAVSEVDGVGGLASLHIEPASVDSRRNYLAMCLSRQLHFDGLSDPDQVHRVLCRVGFDDLLN